LLGRVVLAARARASGGATATGTGVGLTGATATGVGVGVGVGLTRRHHDWRGRRSRSNDDRRGRGATAMGCGGVRVASQTISPTRMSSIMPPPATPIIRFAVVGRPVLRHRRSAVGRPGFCRYGLGGAEPGRDGRSCSRVLHRAGSTVAPLVAFSSWCGTSSSPRGCSSTTGGRRRPGAGLRQRVHLVLEQRAERVGGRGLPAPCLLGVHPPGGHRHLHLRLHRRHHAAALKADCTGTFITPGPLWVMLAAGAITIGLGGLGASTELSIFTSETGIQSS